MHRKQFQRQTTLEKITEPYLFFFEMVNIIVFVNFFLFSLHIFLLKAINICPVTLNIHT